MGPVEEFVESVCSELLLPSARIAEIREELLRHFQDGVRERMAQGMPKEQATNEALEQAGSAAHIAKRFRESYRKRFLRSLAIWLGGLGALAAGAILADGINRGPADHGGGWNPRLEWLVIVETPLITFLGPFLLSFAILGFPNPRRAFRDGRFWRHLSESALVCGGIAFVLGISESVPYWFYDGSQIGYGLAFGIVGLAQGILICCIARCVPPFEDEIPDAASSSISAWRASGLAMFLIMLCASVWMLEGGWPWRYRPQSKWAWETSFAAYPWLTFILLGGFAVAGLRDGFSKTFDSLRKAFCGQEFAKRDYERVRNLGFQFVLLGAFAFFAIAIQGLEDLSEAGRFERQMISAFGCLGLSLLLCATCRVYAGAGPSNNTSESGFLRKSGTEQPEAA